MKHLFFKLSNSNRTLSSSTFLLTSINPLLKALDFNQQPKRFTCQVLHSQVTSKRILYLFYKITYIFEAPQLLTTQIANTRLYVRSFGKRQKINFAFVYTHPLFNMLSMTLQVYNFLTIKINNVESAIQMVRSGFIAILM